ncbi:hypothetical protein PVAND_011649 [Polypedilum vanderplanki]|uniref:Nudix hydrolase domain-containing protein n=1 Tax=Polypedilum vanderplanki TaxID=319348 RepID=A0A9J6CJ94_POLVA|nr:hypothetical protein PVAND_011649 [Polypedilum vanderplanki]
MNKIFKHIVCRNQLYANQIQRFPVPDEFVPWSVNYDNYKPQFYESPTLNGKPWADEPLDSENFKPKYNQLDGNVNRKSHIGEYKIVNRMPQNIFGRTGICGRGVLGRFGPNHAADPIVSTWKRDENNKIVKHSDGKAILKVLCIQRGDTNEIALPGGMVDPGENVSVTLKREFMEETLNNKIDESVLDDFFSHGIEVYKGYIDDPRNTDNAWMETVAFNFHDESGDFLKQLNFEAGDDAVGIHWIDVSRDVKLYASHLKLIEATAQLRNAHF